jgi:hypothetical protein
MAVLCGLALAAGGAAVFITPLLASTGDITTIAGGGGSLGDGGPATAAQLDLPEALLHRDGEVFIADTVNDRVRKIDTAGVITTIAGTGSAGFSGDGGPATAAQLGKPRGLAPGPDGGL